MGMCRMDNCLIYGCVPSWYSEARWWTYPYAYSSVFSHDITISTGTKTENKPFCSFCCGRPHYRDYVVMKTKLSVMSEKYLSQWYYPVSKTARIAKNSWRKTNTIATIWRKNMLGHFLTVFFELEKLSFRATEDIVYIVLFHTYFIKETILFPVLV